MIKKPKKQTAKVTKTEKLMNGLSVSRLVFIVPGGILVFFSGYLFMQQYLATHGTAELPTANTVITTDTAVPDEKVPDMKSEYNVPADQPRRIVIDDIDVNGFIQQVGLNTKNAISVPNNVHIAGWFIDSAKPGDAGLSIIDGHVSGRYNDGIFKDLGKLKAKSRFTIEYGDLSTKVFEVIEVKQVPESEATSILLTKENDIEKQLNLITCGGRFDSSNNTYKDRVIVTSKALL